MAVKYETLKITDWDSTDDDSEADITVFNEIENKKISDDSAEINELFENM
jgi:hypothetical protein